MVYLLKISSNIRKIQLKDYAQAVTICIHIYKQKRQVPIVLIGFDMICIMISAVPYLKGGKTNIFLSHKEGDN